jgi:two-component system chemotaxis response regulator CheB
MGDLRGVAVIGGSAGAQSALLELIPALKAVPVAVLVVVHVSREGGKLADLLMRHGPLPATRATDGAPITPGSILVAPPGMHMVVEPGQVRLSSGPRENGNRPAIDPLFRTAARTYGRNVIGVVLSGSLDDGTYGLALVKAHRGTVIVQQPETAAFPEMPQTALRHVDADWVLPPREIGERLRAIAQSLPAVEASTMQTSEQNDLAEIARAEGVAGERHATVLSCPDCHGVMMRLDHPRLLHFECQMGHARSPLSLERAQEADATGSLVSAVRALRERAILAYMMSERARERNRVQEAAELGERGHALELYAQQLESMLAHLEAHHGTRGETSQVATTLDEG